ncbi:MAG: PorV/PorQ family protein [Bacteroidia bacterium]
MRVPSIKTATKIVLLLSILFPSIAIAQIDGRSFSPWRHIGGLEFLTLDIAPQNAALANAGVANPNGGFLQNPALLASQKDNLTLSAQYSRWMRSAGIRDFHYGAARVGIRLDDKRVIGLSYQQFSSFLTDWFFEPVLPIHQLSPRLYYAQNQRRFNWGVSLGYVRARLDAFSSVPRESEGITLSGGISTNPYQFWGASWVFAASLSDLGPRQTIKPPQTNRRYSHSYLPTTFRIGGQSSISKPNTRFNIHYQFEHLLVPRDLDSINSGWFAPIQSIHDAPWGQNWQEWQFKLGLEWTQIALGERLALGLRLGWQYEAPEQGDRHLLTTGFGLQSKYLALDMAYWVPLNGNWGLANTMIFGLAYRWNPEKTDR